jgi:hypothetical protein
MHLKILLSIPDTPHITNAAIFYEIKRINTVKTDVLTDEFKGKLLYAIGNCADFGNI